MANLPHGSCLSTITDYCYFYFYHFIFVTKISRVTANVVGTGSGTNGEQFYYKVRAHHKNPLDTLRVWYSRVKKQLRSGMRSPGIQYGVLVFMPASSFLHCALVSG